MPVYQYKGRNQRGEAVRGQLEAPTVDAVANQLFNTGVTPIDIAAFRPSQDVFGTLRGGLGGCKIALHELILFSRQMHTLLKAGVPILQALRGLSESSQNPALARVLRNVRESLDAGQDLTTALKRHPKVFPALFVSLVQVGEATGGLDGAFLQLAKYLELEKQTRERVKAALRYPAMVMAAIVFAIFVINILVIPAFAKIYATFNMDLPLLTRLLIAVSGFMVAWWHVILIGMAAVIFAVREYVRTGEGRYRWHKLKIHLPLVGSIIYRASLGRFARAFAVTVKAGVPLIQSLTVMSRAVDNEFIGARVMQMRDGVERGETIARTAAATGMFPPLVLQMIAVGEESGAVDRLMEDVADYYEREVEYDLKNLAATIEPVLIVAIGFIVLVLALGVFLPMWDLARLTKL